MKKYVAIIAAALLSTAAWAQDKKAEPKKKPAATAAAPGMPKPGPEMKELRDLVGSWTTDEAYEESPMMKAGTGSGSVTARMYPGGFSLIMEVRSKSTMGAFSGHGVMSWDPNDKVYKYAWVDSMTPGLMLETGKKEGNDLVFTGEIMMMGKKYTNKDVISDRTPTSYTLTSYSNDGSGEKKVMTIKATKQEPPAATAKK
ncbi:MAG TPA: DUF1579 family protein [Bryobacteraceae bacterium]|nr:DUF1579 family protein [Bryobacteraceae bacterium]